MKLPVEIQTIAMEEHLTGAELPPLFSAFGAVGLTLADARAVSGGDFLQLKKSEVTLSGAEVSRTPNTLGYLDG